MTGVPLSSAAVAGNTATGVAAGRQGEVRRRRAGREVVEGPLAVDVDVDRRARDAVQHPHLGAGRLGRGGRGEREGEQGGGAEGTGPEGAAGRAGLGSREAPGVVGPAPVGAGRDYRPRTPVLDAPEIGESSSGRSRRSRRPSGRSSARVGDAR